jgi:hypothetical protein
MRSILERLAIGENPVGTVLQGDTLHFRNKQISLLDRPNILTDLQVFFHTVVGIPKQFDTEDYKQWKEIKKKYIKNFLLEAFVMEKQKEYALTLTQTNQLLATIHLGITFKHISIQDIVYNDGKIQSINHLHFKPHEYTFDSPILPTAFTLVKHNFNEKISLAKLWQSYLKQVRATA